MSPDYSVTIGENYFEPRLGYSVLSMDVRTSLEVPVNYCRVVLEPQVQALINREDDVVVKLGYNNQLQTVFTGKVHKVCYGVTEIIVEAMGSFKALVNARFHMLYEKRYSGQMVMDLVGKLCLQPDIIENGIRFLSYAMSKGLNVWDHISELAWKNAFDFYATVYDKLFFGDYNPKLIHGFNYGVDLLCFQECEPMPQVDGVIVYGESPADCFGECAVGWFKKKELKAVVGSSVGTVFKHVDPSTRNTTETTEVAKNIMKGFSKKAIGQFKVVGRATLKLGDAINVMKVPKTNLNGTYKITGIHNKLNSSVGYITDITGEKL